MKNSTVRWLKWLALSVRRRTSIDRRKTSSDRKKKRASTSCNRCRTLDERCRTSSACGRYSVFDVPIDEFRWAQSCEGCIPILNLCLDFEPRDSHLLFDAKRVMFDPQHRVIEDVYAVNEARHTLIELLPSTYQLKLPVHDAHRWTVSECPFYIVETSNTIADMVPYRRLCSSTFEA